MYQSVKYRRESMINDIIDTAIHRIETADLQLLSLRSKVLVDV